MAFAVMYVPYLLDSSQEEEGGMRLEGGAVEVGVDHSSNGKYTRTSDSY